MDQPYDGIERSVRRAVNEILERGQTDPHLVELVELARTTLAKLTVPLFQTMSLACRAGCAWCCSYLIVASTIPEVLVIGKYLRERQAAADLEEVRQRVTAANDRLHRLDRFQPLRPFVPCPLLTEDNRCSVYEVRPLICQVWHSAEVRLCQQPNGLSQPDPAVMALYSSVYCGLMAALVDHGLESHEVGLIAALEIALNTPQVSQRWLAGESLFASAAAPPLVTRLAAS